MRLPIFPTVAIVLGAAAAPLVAGVVEGKGYALFINDEGGEHTMQLGDLMFTFSFMDEKETLMQLDAGTVLSPAWHGRVEFLGNQDPDIGYPYLVWALKSRPQVRAMLEELAGKLAEDCQLFLPRHRIGAIGCPSGFNLFR